MEVTLTGGPHCHVASTSAKPHSKPPGWPNVTGFESWMVKATRFWSWMAKIKLGQELDGQKWTLLTYEWPHSQNHKSPAKFAAKDGRAGWADKSYRETTY